LIDVNSNLGSFVTVQQRDSAGGDVIKVLHVAAEAYPLIKTGGLGDVVGALPKALTEIGADVRVMIPGYGDVLRSASGITGGPNLGPLLNGLSARLLTVKTPGVRASTWLVDCPELYNRSGGPYQGPNGDSWPDNHLRFALLARAAALIAISGDEIGWRPDIVHVHDWHTGLVPYYVRNWGGPLPRTVFTVHSMDYQGLFPATALERLALRSEDFTLDGLEFWNQVCFLKAGLVYADRITTVSSTYAKEIRSAPRGCGLEDVLEARAADVVGITNGIDDGVWDPGQDRLIARTFSARALDSKQGNKSALKAMLGLAADVDKPLIGVVSRLVQQKGIDLIVKAAPTILKSGFQLAFLGTGDVDLESQLDALARRHPKDMAVRIAFDEGLAHFMYAGCDLMLVPSRFEPCGLTQLYAQRYGALPIVHRVGGLADTVSHGRDGFSFDEPTVSALIETIRQAGAVYGRPATWKKMQRTAMSKDVSWKASAQAYLELYQTLLQAQGTRP